MHAPHLGDRRRAAVESAALPAAEGHVTISVGVAWQPASDESAPADLVGRADQALYRAKHAGRNRVHLSSAMQSSDEPVGPPA